MPQGPNAAPAPAPDRRGPAGAPRRWDVFCRVVDNFGDIGVCWRLAADLAGRGERVRLWTDDARALAWMAPGGHPGVAVRDWAAARAVTDVGDVVVEAFGCDPPDAFVARMADAPRPPVWLNLEYLSAEAYVERSHALPSPQSGGPGAGLVKWFFYPGFTAATGGLLREPDVPARWGAFERDAWLAAHGAARRPDERVVTVFCYAGGPVNAWLDALGDVPTLLLAAPGPAAADVAAALGPGLARGTLRAVPLPWLPQPEFDRALHASDLAVVRGEDSFVRAQWVARPFVWHIYPQDDGAHAAKLHAFMARHFHGADPAWADATRGWWAAWNGLAHAPAALPPLQPWQAHVSAWRDALLGQPDLVTRLRRFVAEKS